MDGEIAVASAAAAESPPPGASLEALKAQEVVTRSYYAAAHLGLALSAPGHYYLGIEHLAATP
jgi:hypothetical protein